MHNVCFFIIFFKNHFLLKIIFWLLQSIWLPGVHCILVLFLLLFLHQEIVHWIGLFGEIFLLPGMKLGHANSWLWCIFSGLRTCPLKNRYYQTVWLLSSKGDIYQDELWYCFHLVSLEHSQDRHHAVVQHHDEGCHLLCEWHFSHLQMIHLIFFVFCSMQG